MSPKHLIREGIAGLEGGGVEAAQGWEEMRKRRNLQPGNPFVPLCTVWQRGTGGRCGEILTQTHVPASFKISPSTWICLGLSPVALAGVYPTRPK